MKSKFLYLIMLTALIIGGSLTTISDSEVVSNFTLADLGETAFAQTEEGEEACVTPGPTHYSRHGFITTTVDCFNSDGFLCGQAAKCQEDKSLEELPYNQMVVCVTDDCANA